MTTCLSGIKNIINSQRINLPSCQRAGKLKVIAFIVFVVAFTVLTFYYNLDNSRVRNETSSQRTTTTRDYTNMTGDISMNKLQYEHLQRRLPTALIIGVRKAGTRALLGFLELHPSVVTCHIETHFFDREEYYVKGLDWYRQQMPYSLPGQTVVEKTPAYFHSPEAAARIHQFSSKLRLILIVRDPVVRAVSDWYQLDLKRVRNGEESIPFETLVLRADGLVNQSYQGLQKSIYASHYKRWTRLFSPRQIHIVDGDAFQSDPVTALRDLEAFLRLPNYFTPDMFVYNATKGFYCKKVDGLTKCLNESKGRAHPPIDPEVRTKLYHYFEKYNGRFFKMIEQTFDWGGEEGEGERGVGGDRTARNRSLGN